VAAEDTAATAVVAMREAGNSREDERRISPSSNVKGIWSESRKGICEVEKKKFAQTFDVEEEKKTNERYAMFTILMWVTEEEISCPLAFKGIG